MFAINIFRMDIAKNGLRLVTKFIFSLEVHYYTIRFTGIRYTGL